MSAARITIPALVAGLIAGGTIGLSAPARSVGVWWLSTAASPMADHFIGMQIVGPQMGRTFDMVQIERADVTVCILKIAEECAFEYDGQTQQFVMRRTQKVMVK